jgi:hypothetical protein
VARGGLWFAGRIFDIAEYLIAGYDTLSGIGKIFSLNYGSSREQHQLAYGQTMSGIFRAISVPFLSLAAKGLYAAGGLAMTTGVGAAPGLGMIALGVGLDTVGSDVASALGDRAGRVIGTASYYRSHPDRLLRDIRESIDRLLGNPIQQRLTTDNRSAESYIDQISKLNTSPYSQEEPGGFRRAFNFFQRGMRQVAGTLNSGLTLGLDLFRRTTQRVRRGTPEARKRAQEIPMTVGSATQTYGGPQKKEETPTIPPVTGTVSVQSVASKQPSNADPRPTPQPATSTVVSYDPRSNVIAMTTEKSASDHLRDSNQGRLNNTHAEPSFAAVLV